LRDFEKFYWQSVNSLKSREYPDKAVFIRPRLSNPAFWGDKGEWHLIRYFDGLVPGPCGKMIDYDVVAVPSRVGHESDEEREALMNQPHSFFSARPIEIRRMHLWLDALLILIEQHFNQGVIFRSLIPTGWRIENVLRVAKATGGRY